MKNRKQAERERLMKLLKTPHKADCLRQMGYDIGKYEEDCVEAMTADLLLANGVLVPPLKIGDTVYSIKDSALFIHSIEVTDVQFNKYGYDFIGMTKNGTYKCFEEDDIGEAYFFTLEEAEKALEERNRRNNVG